MIIQEAFLRVFVDDDLLDRTSTFYQSLLDGKETMRFDYPKVGLQLAAVSSRSLSVLIIAGTPEKRRPYEATRLTVKVASLEPAIAVLRGSGAEQIEPVQETPVGRKTRFRHPDGLIVEYVDHRGTR
jgi:hypothetical protein